MRYQSFGSVRRDQDTGGEQGRPAGVHGHELRLVFSHGFEDGDEELDQKLIGAFQRLFGYRDPCGPVHGKEGKLLSRTLHPDSPWFGVHCVKMRVPSVRERATV